jgi:hypothetical protein
MIGVTAASLGSTEDQVAGESTDHIDLECSPKMRQGNW